MSKVSYFRMSVVCLLILLGGAIYGAMGQPAFATPNKLPCDNKCRSRNTFISCQPSGATNCFYLSDTDVSCLMCSGGNNRCSPQGSDTPNATCTSGNTQVTWNRMGSCALTCPCDPSLQYTHNVEANLAVAWDSSVDIANYSCQ